jgi:hypothetical protein
LATTGPGVRPRGSKPFVPPHNFFLWDRFVGTGGGESGALKLIVAASVGAVASFGAAGVAGTFSGRGRLQAAVSSKESVRSKRWPVSRW